MKAVFRTGRSSGGRSINFTLVELLIVISMIAILAGMLLPALNSARNKAQTVQCMNNLKQDGGAVIMYAADSDDYAPKGRSNDIGEVNDTTLKAYWSEVILTFHYLPNGKTLICPYVLKNRGFYSKQIWQAQPGFYRDFSKSYDKDTMQFSYGMNSQFNNSPKMARIKSPSAKVMLGDSRTTPSDAPQRIQSSGIISGSKEMLSGTYHKHSRLYPWHQTSANLTFVDGHAVTAKAPLPGYPGADHLLRNVYVYLWTWDYKANNAWEL